MNDMQTLYAAHVKTRQARAEAALAATDFDAAVITSGTPFTYFADDMDAPLRTTPHFAHWVPLEGPQHLLVVHPGKKPLLVRVKPEDYWYEQAPLRDPFWLGAFEFHEVPDEDAAWKLVPKSGRVAYVGDSADSAHAHGIAPGSIQPPSLVSRLDWDRATKTPYEIACLAEATRVAGLGHKAARAAFVEGASELDIHHAYVQAVGCVDKDLPYESIIALDEKGATLHYTGKRTQRDGRVLLIDCGAKHLGYGSDITRTWTLESADPVFRDIVGRLDVVQKELCALAKPGVPYPRIHHAAHVKIADLLRDVGITKVGGEDAVTRGLTRPFFPHGVGHFLGIQVHDVGGRQKSPEGGVEPPPQQHPYLRTTRTIETGHVFTIEPGIYFIEMLLRPLRSGADARQIDWPLVDRLTTCGGVRIEDNLAVTQDGHTNLTRPHV